MTFSSDSHPHKTRVSKAIQDRLGTVAGGSRILFDPEVLTSNDAVQFDVLPLLFDRVLIPDPTRFNVARWKLDARRLELLVAEDIATPIATGAAPLSEFPTSRQLTREDILKDAEFFSLYEHAVAEDQKDPQVAQLCSDLSDRANREVTVESVAFNANWDFLVSMALRAPIASSSVFQSLWDYKLSMFGEPRLPNAPAKETSAEVAVSFLKDYTLKLPSQLTIDDLKALRKENVARNFRNWFSEALSMARVSSKVDGIDVNKTMIKEFEELVKHREARQNYAVTVGEALVAVGLSPIIGPLGAVVAVGATTPPFKLLASRAASHWGSQRWIGIFTDVRRRKRSRR